MIPVSYYFSESPKTMYEYNHNLPNGAFVFCKSNKRMYLKVDEEIVGITLPRRKNFNCLNCGAPLMIPKKYSAVIKCDYCKTYQDIETEEVFYN